MPRPMFLFVLAAFAVVACGKEMASPVADAATRATAAAISAPEKAAGFTLAGTVSGERVEFRSAVAAKRPNSEALQVLVSTHPRACKDLEGSYSLSKDETIFRMAIAPGLGPKHAGVWHVIDTYYDSASLLGTRDVDVKVDGGDANKPVTITLGRLALDGFQKRAPLEAQGVIVAKGCGVVEEKSIGPGAPGPAKPQPKLTFKVGDATLDVLGARFETKSKQLVLSTSPLSCTSSYSYADVSLLLSSDGKSANLQGHRVGRFTGSTPKPAPRVILGARSGSTMPVTLDGSFTHEDWPVSVKGSATVDVCSE
jgi:hypothetical protein